MPDRRIFVSCGQHTDAERQLGRNLQAIIEAHRGMRAFFADTVHSAAGLNAEIFQAIQACHAFLAVLQHRGEVHYASYPPAQRSSVWIQQEIGIFAYRMFLEGTPRPIRVYEQRGMIRPIEGLMGAAIVNPIIFDTDAEVIAGVEEWLRSREFEADPLLTRREDSFRRRIHDLTGDALLFLELIAAHSASPGDRIDYMVVRTDFFDALNVGRDDQGVFERMETARRQLLVEGLLGMEQNPERTLLLIHRQWWQLVLDEFRGRGHRL